MPYDVWLSDNGDLPSSSILYGLITEMKDDEDIVMQRCIRRLKTHAGEWVLDDSVGIPYMQWMNKKIDVGAYKLFIKSELQQVLGINRAEVDASFNVDLRKITLSVTLFYDNGQTRFLNVQPVTVLYQKMN